MVEWNNIEKMVTDRRGDFESEIQNPDHEAKFFSKLEVLHQSQVVKSRFRILKYAASFAVLFIISVAILWFYYYLNFKHEVNFAFNQGVNEFNEASKYYTSQIYSGIEQIKKLPFNEPHQIDSIFAEFSLMDENKKQLMDELSLNPDDERIMGAIINVYIVKLDAINQIMQSFSISQTKKIYKHENNI